MPKYDKEAAASHGVFVDPDHNETGIGDTLTDNALLLAVAGADQAAFSVLMRRHVPTMVALARRITLNASDADEVVQEAFIRVWINAGRWDANGPAMFRTWLRRIVTNLAIDRDRKPKNLPLEVAGDPADPLMDVEGKMERSDEAKQVQQALQTLPPRQRAAVALCYFDEMPVLQAADVLGLSVGAVESLLVRARRNLKHLLDDKVKIGKDVP